MVLARFFAFLLLASIGWAFVQLLAGQMYSLGPLLNGKQGQPVVIGQWEPHQVPDSLLEQLRRAGAEGIVRSDTLLRLNEAGLVEVSYGKQPADGLFPTCRYAVTDLWLPLIGYLTFFCGLMQLLTDSRATEQLSRRLAPFFTRIFPDLPKGHPAYGFMTMNFAANLLGLDNAATPFGLKAMQSMQEVNPNKDVATNSQIMFLTLHAAGLTLIPTSLISYRAALQAANPTDIMLPLIITSFIGTVAALVIVGLRQRINLLQPVVVMVVGGIAALIALLLFLLTRMSLSMRLSFTANLSNGLLLFIILAIIAYAWWKEKEFQANNTNLFDSFVTGAKEGFQTGLRILPYMVALLGAISLFRNSGLMELVIGGLGAGLQRLGVSEGIIEAIPVALMRPFSAGGSRAFMLDAMKTYGPDSFAGILSTLFQGAAETTFYVVALYYGAVQVKNTRYTIGAMLLVDLVCVLTAIAVVSIYFAD
ncbi:MAG: nucleoside recognition domain-containing protein [Chitinophagales bacterium]|nr:spore maturation protein [Chitinophagales bacterium]MDW8394214.1 nucleoside recognition domain-containing protein [Chitinophagales bacterium]